MTFKIDDEHGPKTATDQPAYPGAVLQIDLSALAHNYRMFADEAAPAECAAAVKGDAYGLGMEPIAKTLWDAGCRTFFVALTQEGLTLRTLLPSAVIYILNGLPPGAAETLARASLRPVLSSLEEVGEWAAWCRENDQRLPAGLHIESGINRLGLTAADVDHFAARPELLDDLTLSLVLSHLVSGDLPDEAINATQVERFETLRAKLPTAPASLANSPGSLSGSAFRFDLVRVGIGLYGGEPYAVGPSRVKPVVRLISHLAQVRAIAAGQSVGYRGTWTAERDSKIAVIPVGYYDGYPRSLSSASDLPHAWVSVEGHRAPVIGRVSMDMITVDVTDLPDHLAVRGKEAELFGTSPTVDELATWAGTISFEVFTGLGSRFARVYSRNESL
ncbi:MAG: alanine racemase [Alphaproteobacteria bacterium]|nr:alanine racemase [Alphaproteobacteria bacterium]